MPKEQIRLIRVHSGHSAVQQYVAAGGSKQRYPIPEFLEGPKIEACVGGIAVQP